MWKVVQTGAQSSSGSYTKFAETRGSALWFTSIF